MTGITRSQVKAIQASIRVQQKFLAEILEHSHRWELSNGELKICFTADKRAFAEMVDGRESLAKITTVARQVLEQEVKVVSRLELPDASSPRVAKGYK